VIVVVVVHPGERRSGESKPRFIGQELELSALAIFLSLLFWSWVLGAIGAIVAVPLTILVKRVIPVIAAGISLPAAPSHLS
jgi:predicted PurR-regulated permease PerM